MTKKMNKNKAIKSALGLALSVPIVMFASQPIDAHASAQKWDYTYTGGYQVFTAPFSGKYKLETWGAQGGNVSQGSSAYGGKGGYSNGEISLQEGEQVYIYVGGQGREATSSTNIVGGWNGGGDNATYGGGATGGGGTDIRLKVNSNPLEISSLNSRLIVSGGGSGAGWGNIHGAPGGGLVGVNGQSWSGYASGLGGTQASGGGHSGALTGGGQVQSVTVGVLGKGGRGSGSSSGGSGGGGGYYGGGGGMISTGGGGSGYVAGTQNGETFSGNQVFSAPNGNTETGHAGNGYARITALNAPAVATISSPAQNVVYDNLDSLLLKGTIHDPDSKGGSMKIQYAIDNGGRNDGVTVPSSTTATAFSIPITLPNLSVGNHTLRVFSIDNEGVEEEKTIAFRIRDNIAPTLNVTGNPTSYVEGNVTLQATASDNSGSTRIKLPDGNWIVGSSASFVVSKNGSYTFVAEDNDGNQTTKTIFVDKVKRIYNSTNFGYTGGYQAWIVPSSGKYRLEVWGAKGGDFGNVSQDVGGNGGYSSADFDLIVGQQLYIYVGDIGNNYLGPIGTGWNGGGKGSVFNVGGGGASDIRLAMNINPLEIASLRSRIIVAGGGGGAGAEWGQTTEKGGYGGGANQNGGNGAIGQNYPQNGINTGFGGTLTGGLGANPGQFGYGSNAYSSTQGGGGGGGWYGGGAVTQSPDGGAGGGSGYVSPSGKNIKGNNGENRGVGYAKIAQINSAPTVTVSTPSSNTEFEAGSSFTLKGTIKDADASGTMTVKYSIDGGSEVSVSTMTNLDTPQDFQKLIDLPSEMTVGNHTLRVWGEDSDTLQSEIITVPFSIRDNIAPSIFVTGNATDWTNGDIILTVKGTDNESGVKRIQLPDGTWVQGDSYEFIAKENGSYTFVVEDGAGNQDSQTVLVKMIDKDNPNAPTGTVDESWTNSDVVFSVTANGDTGGSGVDKVEYMLQGATANTWTTYSSPIHVTAEGITTIVTRVVDKAGNISKESSNIVQIDKTAPQLSGEISPSTWTNGNVSINMTATDDSSGVKHIELPNGNKVMTGQTSYTVSSNGIYTFHSEDKAGNTISKTISVSNIDKEKPNATHTIEHVEGDVYQVFVDGSDSLSGVKQIKLPNGDFSNGASATFSVKKGETYVFEVEDKAGNKLPYSITIDVPELNVYQKDNHVKAEWAINMLEQDVMYETGFETNEELPNLVYSNGRTGGQSFDTVEKFNGNRSLKVSETINQNGNYFNGNDLFGNSLGYSEYSLATFTKKKYVPNGTDLSLSFRAKTTGKSSIMATAQGGSADFGKPTIYKFTKNVEIGDKTVKVDNPQFFKNYVDKGSRFYIALMKGPYSYGYPVSVDMANSTITLNTPFKGAFEAGESVLQHQYINPATFSTRSVNVATDWTLYNVNVKILDNIYYDTSLRGFALWLRTTATNDVYIDDIKMGYATKAQLFRGDKKIYEGLLSDYEDKEATDKEKPNPVDNIQVNMQNGKVYMEISEPQDNGTDYDYTVKAVSNKDDLVASEKKTATVTTGIDGYSYVVDTNPNTIPDDKVDTTSTSVPISITSNAKYYVHIKAIDKAGNISDVKHLPFQDNSAPEISITQNPTSWTNQSVLLTAVATDEGLGIKRIQLPNGTWVNGETASCEVSVNGKYTFIAEDNVGNQTTKVITVSNIDTTAPTAPTIVTNQNWTKVTPVSVSITSGTDSQSGVKRVEYRLEGATNKGWSTYTNAFQILNEGETKIEARTIDNLGQYSEEDTAYVRIDQSAPYNIGITIQLKK